MRRLVSFTLLALALSAVSAAAEPTEAPARASRAQREPTRSIQGRIAIVSRVASEEAGGHEVRVWLRTDAGHEIDVRLAPDWFLESKGFRLNVGEKLVVRGWRLPVDGHVAVLARSVHHEKAPERALELRDAEKSPAWARQHKQGHPPNI
jgi:hypothetical protein